jgi:protein phosphatase
VAGFGLLLVALVGGAVATIQWYGSSTYYVGYREGQDSGEVLIFKGRPGGVLWVEPHVEQRTGVRTSQVKEQYRDALRSGEEQSSLTKAERYVTNITTTTTTTTTTSTTAITAAP